MGSAAAPREVQLLYRPVPWYAHWWVWGLGALVVGGAAVGGTLAATSGPPQQFPSSLQVR